MSSTRLDDPVPEPFSGSAHDLEDRIADIPYILALCERLLDHLDHINEDPDVMDEARHYLYIEHPDWVHRARLFMASLPD